jgi:hypothetical protein
LAAATATILEVETAHRNNPGVVALQEAVEILVGSTIPNIVEARHIATVQQQTGLAAPREATLLPTVRQVPDNSLAVRAAISPVAVPEVVGLATGQAEELERAIERGVEERTASEAGISRAAVAETEMPSGEVLGVLKATTDRAHAPAAIAALPACDLEVEAVVSVVAAGAGAGKKPTGAPT